MGNEIQIPYSARIHGGIQVGTDVVLHGRTTPSFKSFSVNLCQGPNYDSGCALHFNPRFDAGKVVRNHNQGGTWGQEETSGGMPFRRGYNFEMHMKVTPHGYKISVNNRHFCDFNHRLPKETVQYLYIEGDVSISHIQFRGGHGGPGAHPHHHPPHGQAFPPAPGYPPAPSYPTGPSFPPASAPGYPPAPGFPAGGAPGFPAGGAPGYPPAPGPPSYPGYPPAGGAPLYNPSVPLTTPIPGGIYPGRAVVLNGTSSGGSRFTINLACGPYDSDDYALHFDVRFNYGSDRNVVIRNHKQGGNYGSEEKSMTYFPFAPNAPFEIMILAEPSSFKIAVNNQHFTEFFHRIQPVQRVNHVNVQGDIRLSQVRFQ